jgi:transcriptional regulator with XRE-family HTH domain
MQDPVTVAVREALNGIGPLARALETKSLRPPTPTLRALARAVGVSHVSLVKIRRGERPASPAIAEKIAAVLEEWATWYEDYGDGCRLAAQAIRRQQRRVRK